MCALLRNSIFTGLYLLILGRAVVVGGSADDEALPAGISPALANASSFAELVDTMPLSDSAKQSLLAYNAGFVDYPDALVWSQGDYVPFEGTYTVYPSANYPVASRVSELYQQGRVQQIAGASRCNTH